MWFALLLWACGARDTFDFDPKVQLFAQSGNTTALHGKGGLVLTDAEELDCDTFKRGLNKGNLWGDLEDHRGVVFLLGYDLAEAADTDSWIGTYGADTRTYQTVDTGIGWSTRDADAGWFEEDGTVTWDASGLRVVIEESGSEAVVGSWEHVWSSGEFEAEFCGTYGAGG